MNHIKQIIFDLGGVLLDLDKQRCIEAFRALGFPQIERMIDLYHPSEIFCDLEKGEIGEREVCDYIRRESGNTALNNEQIVKAYCAFLVGIPAQKLQMILRLREAGIPTYLLSNTNEMVWGDVEAKFMATGGRPIDDYFDKLYLSFKMHDLKPSPSIFQQVIADSGIVPNETLFIDDGEQNVQTAHRLGFNVYMPQPHEDFSHLFDQIVK